MNTDKWTTKEDIIRDLSEATGNNIADLDEEYLVGGKDPPPRHIISNEDDEMELLFGDAVNKTLVQDDTMDPDLIGITQMLRTVLDFDEVEDDTEADFLNPDNAVIAITKPTHLNPCVEEFVPKSGAITSSPSSNILNNDGNVETNKPMTDSINTENMNETNCNNNVNKLNSDDVKVLADQLKNEISNTSKSNLFENKRQKNVAIATLLKLYATNDSSVKAGSSKEKLKLLTPQDFEERKDILLDSKIRVSSENIRAAQLPYDASKSSLSSETNYKPSSSSFIPSECSSPNKSPSKMHKSIPPEVSASIKKVNKWFDEPAKKQTPKVFIGPITFKKKESIPSQSPVPTTTQNNTQPSHAVSHYVPSNYASDLTKMYMERNKSKEVESSKVTLSNLHEKLKEKDLEIKTRKENESSS